MLREDSGQVCLAAVQTRLCVVVCLSVWEFLCVFQLKNSNAENKHTQAHTRKHTLTEAAARRTHVLHLAWPLTTNKKQRSS